MDKRAKRICFLGKNGIGKSVVVSNISAALCRQGRRVLQVGNDISMSSTLLHVGEQEIAPLLEAFREEYVVDLEDFIVRAPNGVCCLELGGITPGAGCMARGIGIADELIEEQGIAEKLELDYILYDISGEIPCTGYILPIRDGIMEQCVVMSTGTFSSLFVANNLLTGILHARRGRQLPISLLFNYVDRCPARALLESYGARVHVQDVEYLRFYQEVENSVLLGVTVFEEYPDSESARRFMDLARSITAPGSCALPVPMSREELRIWSSQLKARRLRADGAPCMESAELSAARGYSGNA